MRHGVYSVSKSLAGALALFHFAQRYGDGLLQQRIVDHVPTLADRPEWQDVRFVDALDMATGTRGGEELDLLFRPLMLAADREQAIANIARLGDAAPAPGERFSYATTNYFVLSYALQQLVESREGSGVRYWDLLRDDVLRPIGADAFDVLLTRDRDPTARIPLLGFGARPTLDEAAKITRLIAEEGVYGGRQLLSRAAIRTALRRDDVAGLPTGDPALRYRHGFWSTDFDTDRCRVRVAFMQGHGGNHILLLPSGARVFHFMDEAQPDLPSLLRGVERIRPSCDAPANRAASLPVSERRDHPQRPPRIQPWARSASTRRR